MMAALAKPARYFSDGVTHVAWQVGHIAFSEYLLAFWRIRGPQPAVAPLALAEDGSLVSLTNSTA
jgi:hypothetical protein